MSGDHMFDGWNEELYHEGVKGMKWGIRRYQNPDGTLTAAGKARYYNSDGSLTRAGRMAMKTDAYKLKRLNKQADLNANRAAIQKYNKRARIAGRIGLASSIAGGLGFAGNEALRRYSNKVFRRQIGIADNNFNAGMKNLDFQYKTWNGLRKKYGNDSVEANTFMNKMLQNNEANYDKWNNAYQSAKTSAEKRYNIGNKMKTAGKVALAGAAVSAGFYAYNKIQARAASKRMSEAGHSKANAKAKEFSNQFMKKWSNVSSEDISKIVKSLHRK